MTDMADTAVVPADRLIKVSLNKLDNVRIATPEYHFIHRAVAALNRAINDPLFEEMLREANFHESRHLNERDTATATIVDIIKKGLELNTAPDHEIDLIITIDSRIRRPVIGKTFLRSEGIRTGRWFIEKCMRKNDVISLAAHFMHEWLHVAGFVHKRNNGPREDVPYIVGDIIRVILRKIGEGEDGETVAELENETVDDAVLASEA